MSLSRLFSAALAGVFASLFAVSDLAAQELARQEAVQSLVADLTAMKSMSAGFHQWVNDAKQTTLQEVTGTMWISRPGMFRWDTNDPYPQQIISDSNVLWIYDLDLEQVTKRKLDKQVGNTPALLLSGDPQSLAASFDITGFRFEETGEVRYDLAPKTGGAMFELLRVHFKNGRLNDMFLRDNLGQTTRIEFEVKSFNQPIETSRFDFKPPADVDVIEDM